METKPELNNLLVTYQNDRKQTLTEDEFTGSFKIHPFETIEYINAVYEREDKPELNIHISKVKDKIEAEWQVNELHEKLSFIFKCSEGLVFLKTFEARLFEELEKHELIDPAGSDPDQTEEIEKLKSGFEKFLGS